MRFPVVLFDLDGTLIDSGPIILASMRHATASVLKREIPDAELMASVGGPGLEAQMRAFGPDRVEELVRVYREHNEPLLLALDRLGAKPADAAYVGDSPYDMQAAQAAGLYAVGVSWGGIHEHEALADADVVVHSAEELLAVL